MDSGLFRQKSMDHISSPEQLHDYMRVTSPRLWMVLTAIVFLLGGFIVYAATTRMESTETVSMKVARGNYITGYIPAGRQEIIRIGMPVRIAGKTGKVNYLDNSIRYRLNVFLENDSPMEQTTYWMSLGEESGVPQLVDGVSGGTLVDVRYDSSGFTMGTHADPEIIRKLEAGDVRVRFWTLDLLADEPVLKDGRIATVSGFETITSLEATVLLDNPGETIPEGTYDAEIVTESTTPVSFLWN